MFRFNSRTPYFYPGIRPSQLLYQGVSVNENSFFSNNENHLNGTNSYQEIEPNMGSIQELLPYDLLGSRAPQNIWTNRPSTLNSSPINGARGSRRPGTLPFLNGNGMDVIPWPDISPDSISSPLPIRGSPAYSTDSSAASCNWDLAFAGQDGSATFSSPERDLFELTEYLNGCDIESGFTNGLTKQGFANIERSLHIPAISNDDTVVATNGVTNGRVTNGIIGPGINATRSQPGNINGNMNVYSRPTESGYAAIGGTNGIIGSGIKATRSRPGNDEFVNGYSSPTESNYGAIGESRVSNASRTRTSINDSEVNRNGLYTAAESNLDALVRHSKHAAKNNNDTRLIWSGDMPTRVFRKNASFSCKVFLGGLPWDMTEEMLVKCFSKFGSLKVEWPRKDITPKGGFVYIIFDSEAQVKNLLDNCTHDYGNGGNWYYKIPSLRGSKRKEVQVIPWVLSDSSYVPTARLPQLDPRMTVFVGALHGVMNAQFLFDVMDTMFGGVIYAGIDTDKNKYPIGSGRVTFNNKQSYMKAVTANFLSIKTNKFTKQVQIDPYLEESPCCICNVQHGPYFCRETSCFNYYCRRCWNTRHVNAEHRPLMRNSNKNAR